MPGAQVDQLVEQIRKALPRTEDRESPAARGEPGDHLFEDGDAVFIPRDELEVRPVSEVASVLSQDVGGEPVKGA